MKHNKLRADIKEPPLNNFIFTFPSTLYFIVILILYNLNWNTL